MRNWLMQLPSAICKLSTQEATGGFSPSLRTENPGEACLVLGQEETGAAAQPVGQRENSPFVCLVLCSGPLGTGGRHARGGDLLLPDHQAHVPLIQKHPHRQGQK